jgi:membrane protease subunit HflK
MLDQYKSGVAISQVLIQEAEVHPDVQEAFQDVQSAKQDASRKENDAGVYRQNLLPNAQGQAIKMRQDAEAYKAQVVAVATGDASRFNAVYTAYQAGPEVTKKRMYLETMENILKNAQKMIVENGGKGGEGVIPYMSLDSLKPAAGGSADETGSISNGIR